MNSDTITWDDETTGQQLRVSPRTLKNWRKAGRGPRPVYLNARTVRYRPADVAAWLDDLQAEEVSDDAA